MLLNRLCIQLLLFPSSWNGTKAIIFQLCSLTTLEFLNGKINNGKQVSLKGCCPALPIHLHNMRAIGNGR